MTECLITPNDRRFVGEDDSLSIQNAIDYAKETGIGRVTVPRMNERTGDPIWIIDRAIILPSDMELILDGAHLRMADGVFDNMFRNFLDTEKEGHTHGEESSNIIIRGVGRALLDGGLHNGLTQGTSTKNGMPHISKNNLILFYNIRDFVIEGLEITRQRWWAINLIFAERGRLSRIHLEGQSDCPNEDGIDLREGCSDIIIERITGQTGDDIVALSALDSGLPGSLSQRYGVEGRCQDIFNIVIRDVIATSVECAVIALRSCDGRRIHDVTIDNIHCTDNYALEDGKLFPDYPKFKFRPNDLVRSKISNTPYTLIRIGQAGYCLERESTLGEVYNIHATNLHQHKGCVIVANVALENCYFGNIYADNEVDYIFTTKNQRMSQAYGAFLRNILIENVFYKNDDNRFATAFDLDCDGRHPFSAENVEISHAFLGNCERIFNVKCEGEIFYERLYGAFAPKGQGSVKKT